MDEIAAAAQEPARFEAVLRPHRSLGPRGFLALMAAIAGVSFAAGAVFVHMGAWPIGGFFGLDVLLVWLAFRLSYRDGRRYEVVRITSDALTVTRVDARGRAHTVALNPYWSRVRVDELGAGQTDLRVGFHAREVSIGRFLSPDEREELAVALRRALADVRTARI